jgi:nucleoside-diphosphate-sugar epimerase
VSGRRVVVTGGAGFLPSHLCDALLARGDEVVAIDNLSTGFERNIAHLADERRFSFVKADVCDGIFVDGAVDAVMHFASPASPPRYLELPIETLRVGSIGTEMALQLAEQKGARFMVASTSEVYGDPLVHPQPETYWGHVNPIGPRSCYDEAKRYAEAVTMAYRRARGVDTVILRIFNTYGPRLDPGDGRVVSNLLSQALIGAPMTVYGDGSQTRSFCFVADEVRGIVALLDSGLEGPVNIGNPFEFTMLELVEQVRSVTGTASEVVSRPLPADDPKQRQPDISIARTELGWEPEVQLAEGLARTAEWFRATL